MGIKLFVFTVYYLQTDGISERINQRVEITIRFFITNYLDSNIVLTLPVRGPKLGCSQVG